MPLLAPPVVVGSSGNGGSGGGNGGGSTGTGGGVAQSFVPLPSDRGTLTWESPNGSSWNLTNLVDGLFTPGGILGLGAAPRSVIADLLPQGGSLVRSVLPQPKTLTLPLYIGDTDMVSFTARWRALIESFTCTDQGSPGQLVFTRADGTARQITCFYWDGLEGDSDTGILYELLPLQLYAPDPFWTSTQAVAAFSFPYQTARNYLAPYLTVGASQSTGASSITIAGSRPAYPLWQFTGPFAGVTCSNGSDSFTITLPAVAGETWTVNTTPGSIGAFSSNGTNLMPYLNWPNAVLWPLSPGVNAITLTLANEGVGAGVEMTYSPRSETA